jgi:spermidine synthase
MSCPPQGFLEASFIEAAKAALTEDGILAINVVSRATGPRLTAISKLQKVGKIQTVFIFLFVHEFLLLFHMIKYMRSCEV